MKSLIKFFFALVILALIFIVFVPKKPPIPDSKKWAITFDGIGPIHIGMKLEQSSIPLHYQLKTEDKTYEFVGKEAYEKLINNACTYVSFAASEPKKKIVGFMLNHGTIVRMDIVDPTLETTAGIKVGDSVQHVKEVYQYENLEVQPDKYSLDGRATNMLYFSPDKKRLIIFDTLDNKVINIRVGQTEEAQLVERCL